MNGLEQLLLYIFVISGLINTVHLGLFIGGANLYDIWQYRRQAKAKARTPEENDCLLPEVTVVVPAFNEELVIERCLDSIWNTNYPRLKAIVHNDMSTDTTVRLVNAYKKRHPQFDLRLVNRRQRAGKAGGVNYCIKRYVRSDLVMTLDADCVIRPDAIENAVHYFMESPDIVGVAANVRILDKRSVLGVLQQFEHLIGYRSKKFYTMANCEFIVGGVASTYRREILQRVGYYGTDTQTEDIGLSMKIVALGNRAHRIVYASDVVAMAEGAHSFRALLKQRYRWKMGSLQNLLLHMRLIGNVDKAYSRSLTFYRMPMAIIGELILLLQPIVIGYVLYLSIIYHTLGFFLGAYLTITVYVLIAIWPDEHLNQRKKVSKSLYAPLLYFSFYIMDAVQVIAIVRCLLHPRQVIRRQGMQTAWTPPTRAGQQVRFS
jgi:cellulose synthase/poly-beta-1,6-N-acetylglucosamine synthase-like glycosyltransferase